MQAEFGSGTLWGIPTYAAGTNVLNANPPVQIFGELQDVSLDVSFDTKMLYGRKQFPDDVARGKGKITGKAKFASISGAMLNQLIFGQVATTGQMAIANEEGPTAIPTTPFQITVAQAATFLLDLGVKYAATGLYLQRVAAGPVAGQYSVSGVGVYTFAAADVALTVLISYGYTNTGIGNKLVITNKLFGFAPKFKCVLNNNYNAKDANVTLFACIASKLTWATKLDDYLIPEFDFDAFADPSGNVIQLDTVDV